jgi:hypothetical protein
MKSFKELFASKFPVNVVQYRDILVHRKALQKLVFDFLDISTGDAESDKYLTKPEAYLLEKQGECRSKMTKGPSFWRLINNGLLEL